MISEIETLHVDFEEGGSLQSLHHHLGLRAFLLDKILNKSCIISRKLLKILLRAAVGYLLVNLNTKDAISIQIDGENMLVFNIHQLIKLLLTIVIIVERVLVIFVDSEPRLLPSVFVNMLACLIRDQVLLAGKLLHLGSQSLVR